MSEVVVKKNSQNLFRCPNCNKKNIHCIGGGPKEDPVEMLKDRCNNNECQCHCRTHYEANNGRLKRYGTIDNTSSIEDMSDDVRNETDNVIDEINKQFLERKK